MQKKTSKKYAFRIQILLDCTLLGNDVGWCTGNSAAAIKRMADHAVGTYCGIVANPYVAVNLRPRTNIDIVAECRRAIVVANRCRWVYAAILPDACQWTDHYGAIMDNA